MYHCGIIGWVFYQFLLETSVAKYSLFTDAHAGGWGGGCLSERGVRAKHCTAVARYSTNASSFPDRGDGGRHRICLAKEIR